jgi:hypothetical protein
LGQRVRGGEVVEEVRVPRLPRALSLQVGDDLGRRHGEAQPLVARRELRCAAKLPQPAGLVAVPQQEQTEQRGALRGLLPLVRAANVLKPVLVLVCSKREPRRVHERRRRVGVFLCHRARDTQRLVVLAAALVVDAQPLHRLRPGKVSEHDRLREPLGRVPRVQSVDGRHA